MSKALVIENLRKVYASGTEALKGINISVEDGEFFALIGPNGAGKSTTIGILTGLVLKTSGKVTVYDRDLDSDPCGVRAYLGVVPQEFNFNPFESVMNIIIFQAGFYGLARSTVTDKAEKLLHSLDLWDKRKAAARTLSGGMKRRLMLARALISSPRLLILDEPTAGLDVELRHALWDFLVDLNAKGTTIILTTHYLEEVENLCQRVAIIDEGKVLADESVSKFLERLESQSLILDLSQDCPTLPSLDAKINVLVLEPRRIEVTIAGKLSFNELFAKLDKAGVKVEGMRNKSNRIEELFIDLVGKKKEEIKA